MNAQDLQNLSGAVAKATDLAVVASQILKALAALFSNHPTLGEIMLQGFEGGRRSGLGEELPYRINLYQGPERDRFLEWTKMASVPAVPRLEWTAAYSAAMAANVLEYVGAYVYPLFRHLGDRRYQAVLEYIHDKRDPTLDKCFQFAQSCGLVFVDEFFAQTGRTPWRGTVSKSTTVPSTHAEAVDAYAAALRLALRGADLAKTWTQIEADPRFAFRAGSGRGAIEALLRQWSLTQKTVGQHVLESTLRDRPVESLWFGPPADIFLKRAFAAESAGDVAPVLYYWYIAPAVMARYADRSRAIARRVRLGDQ